MVSYPDKAMDIFGGDLLDFVYALCWRTFCFIHTAVAAKTILLINMSFFSLKSMTFVTSANNA